jgi:hypothetical protein
VVVGGAFTLGQLQNGAVLPTLAAQNITVSSDFLPSDPDRAVRVCLCVCVSQPCNYIVMIVMTAWFHHLFEPPSLH